MYLEIRSIFPSAVSTFALYIGISIDLLCLIMSEVLLDLSESRLYAGR